VFGLDPGERHELPHELTTCPVCGADIRGIITAFEMGDENRPLPKWFRRNDDAWGKMGWTLEDHGLPFRDPRMDEQP